MKASQQLLRFGTIAFFVIMVAGPVLYRCSTSKKQETSPVAPVSLLKEASPKPWFDSIAFQKATNKGRDVRMISSKSGPAFSDYPMDTVSVLLLMQMRYETVRLNNDEIINFHQILERMNSVAIFSSISQDSIHALSYLKSGAASGFSGLTPEDREKITADLKSRSDRKMGAGMTPYLGLADTIMALSSWRITNIRK